MANSPFNLDFNSDFGATVSEVTGMKNAIPAYLYSQYARDDDLQTLVAAYNEQAQEYVDWFNEVQLPVYVNLDGDLLDWVAEGLYGIKRPYLFAGPSKMLGPFNTYVVNGLAFNTITYISPATIITINDDVFKRILTWNLYRGDGRHMSISWLKRRLKRFLIGVDGTDPSIDSTDDISVTFGDNKQVNIHLPVNDMSTTLKEALDEGVLQLPFQFTYAVTIET